MSALPISESAELVARFAVAGEPVSKARARFTNYGSKTRAYTPQRIKDAEQGVALAFRSAGGQFEADREVTFAVVATFHNATRQRRDVDNMLKLILDGLNGVAWVDDTQVMDVTGSKRFVAEKEGARTEVAIYRTGTLDRMVRTCEECGEQFVTYRSWGKRRYCSEDCSLAKRRLARRRTCETCGMGWDPGKPSKARFCSRACHASAGWTDVTCDHCGTAFKRRKCHVKKKNYCTTTCRDATFRDQRRERAKGTCVDCKGPVSEKRYERCQPCRWAYIKAQKEAS